jgi:hypothetical protein
MCLQTITHGPNPQEEGEGYKLFIIEEGELLGNFALRNPDTNDRFVPTFQSGKWLTDPNNYPIEVQYGECYPTRYHFFANKADAELVARSIMCVVRKVRYKNVTAKGRQSFYVRQNNGLAWKEFPVIVAKEIFIEPEEPPKE